MGNSGSQATVTENILPESQWPNSFPRSDKSHSKLHFQHKVLPQKKPQLKLRPTNNGEILQSGGTISGRHIRFTDKKNLRSFEEYKSITKNEEDKHFPRNTAIQRVQDNFSNNISSPEMKSFASEPDLRNIKFREKKTKKKYKAPLPPKLTALVNVKALSSKENISNPIRPNRKTRLFKTRVETKKQSSHLYENSEDVLTNVDDISDGQSKASDIKRLSLPDVKLVDANEFYKELKDATERFRCIEKDNFTNKNGSKELPKEKLKTLDPSKTSHRELKEKLIEKFENPHKNFISHFPRGEASGKESTTPEMSPSPKPRYHVAENLQRPKQIFYFGMDEQHTKKNDLRENIFNNFNINTDLQNSSVSDISSDIDSDENGTFKTGIDLQLRPILPKKQLEIPRFSPAAAWRLLSIDTLEDDNETLPTTHTEDGIVSRCGGTIISDDVPLLMEEHIEKYSRPLPPLVNAGQRSSNEKSGDSGISGDDPVPIVYCYDDEDYENSVAKTNSNKNIFPIRHTRKTERTSWTPQQDLEDDSSAEEDEHNKHIKPRPRTHAGPHMFSLSLPRENRLSTYLTENINIGQLNGLNKFKKSLSGVWGNLYSKKDFLDSSFSDEKSNNWFLSKSAPNSLTHVIHSLGRHKIYHQEQSGPHIDATRRLMYLPEIDFIPKSTNNSDSSNYKYYLQSKSCENLVLETKNKSPVPLQDADKTNNTWDTKKKSKKYTFQSTIRQIEKKRLSDKLSREAEKRERERVRELDAMQKVEEEFQKKRAREKANIRQQLRLFSLDENRGCQSLPAKFDIQNKDRSEPDGAFSSDSSSSSSSYLSSTPKNTYLNKLPQEVTQNKHSSFDNKLLASSTKELSEFRQMQRDYKDYNSTPLKYASKKTYINNRHTTIHPQVSCNMPKVKGMKSKEYHKYRSRLSTDGNHTKTTTGQTPTYNNYFTPF